MATIYHQVSIRANRAKVYEAITTQAGLSRWWIADCVAKPEIGFVNEFKVGAHVHNKMKVIALRPDIYVEWECLNENHDWLGTHIIYDLRAKGENTILFFKQAGWKEESEFFANCNFHWARHLTLLKAFCETGENQIDKEKERKTVDRFFEGK